MRQAGIIGQKYRTTEVFINGKLAVRTQEVSMMRSEFYAEWIANPLCEDVHNIEYRTKGPFRSKQEAERVAEKNAAECGEPDWWRVEERVPDPNHYGPGLAGYETINAWYCGEWERP